MIFVKENGTVTGVVNAPRSVDPVAQKRCYAVPAYLGGANSRKNIHIVTEAHVSGSLSEIFDYCLDNLSLPGN
jgi:hypothetical protein